MFNSQVADTAWPPTAYELLHPPALGKHPPLRQLPVLDTLPM
jgi:hypothetical protein